MMRFCVVGLILGTAAIAADTSTAPVTFAKDVAPILQAKCEECHRKGTAAPMSLITFDETRPWAKSIKARVVARQMPPWHIDKTSGIQEFQNDRSLSDAQIATIVKWVDSGAPLGDKKDLPAAKVWPSDESWQLAKKYGEPDMVIKSDPYTMPATGQDIWWKPVSAMNITEPRWVRAVEIRPGTSAGRKITHHAIAHLIQDEKAPQANSGDDDPAAQIGGTLMEWAIGKQYDDFRPNTGKLLLPGSQIRWDIHLHSVGESVRDHVELAVYLYPKGQEPKYRTQLTNFGSIPRTGGSNGLDIPPNSMYQTQAFHVLNSAARLENFQPHMHLRGKAMMLEAIMPDGQIKMLSYVDNFNFNWMNNYIYTDESAPVLPKGTIIRVTSWYDNTAANKNNPDHDQWVGYGDRTVDEMGHAWVNVTNISDADYQEYLAKQKAHQASLGGRAGAR